MENKILVADDSPTIQKVISITLANKDFELDTAQSEEELNEKLGTETYALVLLDYNLSDTSAGIDLAKQIKENSPATLVMAMLGTFDSVEESALEDAGFSDKIVKPFESSKFIQKIESLLSGTDDDEGEGEEQADSNSFDSEDWSIDGPSVIEEESFSDRESESESADIDPLVAEMVGWGMSVPEVIGEEGGDNSILPPSIEVTEVASFSPQDLEHNDGGEIFSLEESDDDSEFEDDLDFAAKSKPDDSDNQDEHQTREIKIPDELRAVSDSEEDTPSFPEDGDLDYPDMSIDGGLDDESDESRSKHLQLTSLDELEPFDDEDLDSTNPQITIGPNVDSPDLVNAINDEISPDDFWAADVEDEEQGIETITDENKKDDDFSIDEHPSVDDTPKTNKLSDSSTATLDALSDISNVGPKLEKVDHESLAEQIKIELLNELKPLIKEMVRDVLDEVNGDTVEKVAWEVIPDLAENLIRKEVKELTQKVIDKHSLS